jgi:hypothetical protein
MRAVWRYPLDLTALNPAFLPDTAVITIAMPVGATLRAVFTKPAEGTPSLYVEVDPNQSEFEERHFVIAGTGNAELDPNTDAYIGTFMPDVTAVFHVYERMSIA